MLFGNDCTSTLGLRDLMIAAIRENVGTDVPFSPYKVDSRYDSVFYRTPTEPLSPRQFRKFIDHAATRFNIDALDTLTDGELFVAYTNFVRRFCTWM